MRTAFQNTYGPDPSLRMWRVVYAQKDGNLLGGEIFLRRDRSIFDALFAAVEKFGTSFDRIINLREVSSDERGEMRDRKTEMVA